MATPLSEQDVQRFQADAQRLCAAIGGAVVGQATAVTETVAAVLAGGHVLLEGVPGLGKTSLVKALGRALGQRTSRVQCTPDIMPADITGSSVLRTAADGARRLVFEPGPLFANMVLVDEINRATPKAQAALLEAMQEGAVTYDGQSHPLPRPFWVLATQNPIELEGTYPLPEAQLDRFLLKVRVPYPDADALHLLVENALDGEPADAVAPTLAPERLDLMMAQAREVVVAPPVRQAAIDLVLATHPTPAASPARQLRFGASPRGLLALLRVGRILALMDGRAHVAVDDLAQAALPALRHRIVLSLEGELRGSDADTLLHGIIDEWRQHRRR